MTNRTVLDNAVFAPLRGNAMRTKPVVQGVLRFHGLKPVIENASRLQG